MCVPQPGGSPVPPGCIPHLPGESSLLPGGSPLPPGCFSPLPGESSLLPGCLPPLSGESPLPPGSAPARLLSLNSVSSFVAAPPQNPIKRRAAFGLKNGLENQFVAEIVNQKSIGVNLDQNSGKTTKSIRTTFRTQTWESSLPIINTLGHHARI
jgi:hypothetical protein